MEKNFDVKDLTENSKNINTTLKVVEIGEPKSVQSKFGEKRVCEVKVADATGCILLSLWDDQIGKIAAGDTISVENGYVSVVRNSMRLNIGKYGKMLLSEEALGDVNTENNISDRHVEQPERRRNDQRGGYGSGYGGGGRSFGGFRRSEYSSSSRDKRGGRGRR